MDLDYSKNGEVKIGMIKYLHKVEEEFPEPIIGTEKSPDGEHLFQVRKETDPQKRYLEETSTVWLLRYCLFPDAHAAIFRRLYLSSPHVSVNPMRMIRARLYAA